MESNSKEKLIIYIKDRNPKMMSITHQTQSIRDATNLLIRQLGQKYYSIKSLFEKLNIKRDELYYIGKELENSYKDIKKDIHLQNQQKRMKDSLYCWFAQHFYSEIFQPNSSLLNQIINYRCLHNSSSANENSPIKNKIKAGTKKKQTSIEKIKPNKELCNITENLHNLKMNQEIDEFEGPYCSNNGTSHDVQNEHINLNFDIGKLLDF